MEKTLHQLPETRPVLLVVDDDPMVRKLVSRGLEALNAEAILEVEDGEAAQRVLKERHVDVVITDVLMPNMDGRELMRWAQVNCPEPVWVVLSGLDTFDAAVDALHLGAFDFLAKPPEVQRVRVAVRNALEHLALTRDRERLFGELETRNRQLAEKVHQLEEMCRMLEDQAERIHADLTRAEVIQRALLPQSPPQLGNWTAHSLYRAGSYVGGDFYDVAILDARHVGVVIADAAGHGVAAAMLSVLFKHRLILWDDDADKPLAPCRVLEQVNQSLFADLSASGGFITAAYLLLDTQSGDVQVASAGHPPVIWTQRSETEFTLFERTGPAIGLEPDARYDQLQFNVARGDSLLLYTDGVLDGGAVTTADLASQLQTSEDDRSDFLQRVYQQVTAQPVADQDDLTMLLLERTEGVSSIDDGGETRQTVTPSPPETSATLLQGVDDTEAFLSIAGTATWMRSTGFIEAAERLLAGHSLLTIDLADCDYLDSTFLGTLHEIVTGDPDKVRVQRLPDSVRALFTELSMEAVLNSVEAETHQLPDSMRPLRREEEDPTRQAERLLKAHEVLASLSDDNREQFQGVVDSLRADLG